MAWLPNPKYQFTVDDTRFIFDGTLLKLADDLFVSRDSETQIQIEVTATDTNNTFSSITETFVIDVLENPTPAHNRDNPYDVNHGGDISAVDALVIINYLNSFGPGPVGEGDLGFCYDVNADGFVTALDALLVVNKINQINNGGGTGNGEGDEGEGEGEQIGPAAPQQRIGPSPFVAWDPNASFEAIDEGFLRDLAISGQRVRATRFSPVDSSIVAWTSSSSLDSSSPSAEEDPQQ